MTHRRHVSFSFSFRPAVLLLILSRAEYLSECQTQVCFCGCVEFLSNPLSRRTSSLDHIAHLDHHRNCAGPCPSSVTKHAWVVQSPVSANMVLVQAPNSSPLQYSMFAVKDVPPGGIIFIYGLFRTQSPYVFTCDTPFPASKEQLQACIPLPLRPSPDICPCALSMDEIILRRVNHIFPLIAEASGDPILASEYLVARLNQPLF